MLLNNKITREMGAGEGENEKYENSLESATWQKRSTGDLRAKLIAASLVFRLSSLNASLKVARVIGR